MNEEIHVVYIRYIRAHHINVHVIIPSNFLFLDMKTFIQNMKSYGTK